jgi:hypothetical protein
MENRKAINLKEAQQKRIKFLCEVLVDTKDNKEIDFFAKVIRLQGLYLGNKITRDEMTFLEDRV